MRIVKSLLLIAQQAKEAAKKMRLVSTEEKNRALLSIAEELEESEASILHVNEQEILCATELSEAMKDRLSLKGRLKGIIADVRIIAQLPDPVGEIIEEKKLKNGLTIYKKRVPIGVIGVIYEARPNVTVDIASLALKTSNCAILRGGKETLQTNIALMEAIQRGLDRAGLPKEALQLIKNPQRSQVKQLVKLDSYIDMIIPRGEGLHRFCIEESTIPVITGGMGICHLYVDPSADFSKSIEVIVNAKVQRPSVCNALDTLLIHKDIASDFLPLAIHALKENGVTFYLDSQAWNLLHAQEGKLYKHASEQDWKTEWLSLILGIKIVDSLDEAIDHIQHYSTNHSDGILTNSKKNAQAFIEAIDSCAVYVNASTRFTDGEQFGLGAEVAVSTQKLHARGPMGLKELTSYKWVVEGNYHIREK